MRVILISLVILFNTYISQAQPFASIGNWETYIPYNNCNAITASDDIIFSANEISVLGFRPADYSYSFYTKTSGLSDIGISTIGFSKEHNMLLVTYINGNLDLVGPAGNVLNKPSIAQNENITGSRAIKHIYCQGDFAYFSTEFGLIAFDLSIGEFKQTTFTQGISVHASTIMGNYIYISTDLGIYRGALSGVNLVDFGVWEKMGLTSGLPANDFESFAIATMQGKVYADVNDTIMRFDGNSWQHINTYYSNGNISLPYCYTDKSNLKFQVSKNDKNLCIATGVNFAFSLNSGDTLSLYYYNPTQIGNVKDFIIDGSFWVGGSRGFFRSEGSGDVFIGLEGPYRSRITDMAVNKNGTLWCAGDQTNYAYPLFDRSGVYRYHQRKWTNFNPEGNPDFYVGNEGISDVISVAIHPKTQEAYFGSYLFGLIKLDLDDTIETYNYTTAGTALQEAPGDAGRTRVIGMDFDDDDNLWICNYGTPRPIVVWKADGTWESFAAPSATLTHVAIDRFGYKWFVIFGGNVLVFDSGDLNDPGDDRYLQINTSNSNLASSVVRSIEADRDGAIWVGTNDGVTIFNCDVFASNCPGLRPVINPDNFNGRLLEAENIRTMASDGANWMWVGTDNGVFLIDAETYEQELYFTEENSPLFDNNVVKIAYDGSSGLTYIGTERGLQAFRWKATTGETVFNKKEVYAFPNPVRPDYDGYVSITNLVEDCNVKITDVSGNLVYEQKAYGGQAVWDGNSYLGHAAAPGVYLVFLVNDDGSQKMVTKFVLVR